MTNHKESNEELSESDAMLQMRIDQMWRVGGIGPKPTTQEWREKLRSAIEDATLKFEEARQRRLERERSINEADSSEEATERSIESLG